SSFSSPWKKIALPPLIFWFALLFASVAQAYGDSAPIASNKVEINLGQTPWKYLKDADPANAMSPVFDDSGWTSVGVPHSPTDQDTFINIESGGGEGQLTGNTNWYRKHF